MPKKTNAPFLLSPTGKDYLWGGTRLKTEYNKRFDLSPLAETWECSTHPDGPSCVSGGEYAGMTLAALLAARPELLGTRHPDGELPILVKLIDAAAPLSVQVHPDDAFAAEFENGSKGKTEMWVVLSAEPGATLVYGFTRQVTPDELRQRIRAGTLEEVLRFLPVKAGDVILVEAGTVHAIGRGILVAEIQENSNLTYRLYDYNRRDKTGALRPLHVEKALRVARLGPAALPETAGDDPGDLGGCEYFHVRRLSPENGEITLPGREDSFAVLLCTGGCGRLKSAADVLSLEKGGCAFVPAGAGELVLSGPGEFLEIVC